MTGQEHVARIPAVISGLNNKFPGFFVWVKRCSCRKHGGKTRGTDADAEKGSEAKSILQRARRSGRFGKLG